MRLLELSEQACRFDYFLSLTSSIRALVASTTEHKSTNMPLKPFMYCFFAERLNILEANLTSADTNNVCKALQSVIHCVKDLTKESMKKALTKKIRCLTLLLDFVSKVADIMHTDSHHDIASFWLVTELKQHPSRKPRRTVFLVCVAAAATLGRLSERAHSTLFMSGTLDIAIDMAEFGLRNDSVSIDTASLVDRSQQLAVVLVNCSDLDGSYYARSKPGKARVYSEALCEYYIV